MEMTDLMIDLETMGTSVNAVVLSIGAVFFDRNTGKTGAEFERFVNLQSCLDTGLSVDADTIKWWLKQDDAARTTLLAGLDMPLHVAKVLSQFEDWFVRQPDSDRARVWGNGPSFDCAIMANLFEKAPTPRLLPWKHWNERCVRTVIDLAGGKAFKKTIPFDGVKHDALSDCKHQIKLVCAALQKIRGEQ